MRPLTLEDNHDHYKKSLTVYKEKSREHVVYDEWYDQVFEEVVVNKLAQDTEMQELRMLGIGVGSGEVDCAMLNKLLPKHSKIRNVAIDVSDHMLTKYRELVKSKGQSLDGVTFEWRKQKFEDYPEDRQRLGDCTKFHFIHALHSLYYMPDVSDALQCMLGMLEKGGITLTMTTSENSGIGLVHRRFPELQVNYIKTVDVRQALDKLGIKYTVYPQPISVDITECFQEESKDGNLLLDFFTHVTDFRENAPDALVQDYLQYLKRPECSHMSGDKVMFNFDWDAIVTDPNQ